MGWVGSGVVRRSFVRYTPLSAEVYLKVLVQLKLAVLTDVFAYVRKINHIHSAV